MEIFYVYSQEKNFVRTKATKRASFVKIQIKNQSEVNIKKKDKLGGAFSLLAHSHPPRDDPNRGKNFHKHLHEIKTDGIDLYEGLKVDDFEKLEEPNNLKINALQLNGDITLTQLFVSKT